MFVFYVTAGTVVVVVVAVAAEDAAIHAAEAEAGGYTAANSVFDGGVNQTVC